MQITNFKSAESRSRDRRGFMRNDRDVAYIWPRGETVMDNLVNRRSRPANEWKVLLEAELTKQGVHFKSVHFNQKAGCGCGCSPGFNIKDEYGYTHGKQYHMDLVD